MPTRNESLRPARSQASPRRRGLKAPTAIATALGIVGLAAVTMLPQGASAAIEFTRAPATASSVDRTLLDPAITESSGLAISGYSRSRLWTHNDSGGGTSIYAIGASGATLATFNLGTASHKDWEGMAQAMTGSTSYLYLGDIGDNGQKRTSIFVHRVAEPSLTATGGALTPTTWEFRYPDGAHNAESLMVNPVDHRIYVVTKSSPAAIYEAPATLSTTSVNLLQKVESVTPGLSDAVFLDGKRFVLRGYVSGWVYSGFGATPTRFPLPAKGESVAVGYTAGTIFIGSEHQYSKVWKVALP